MGGWGRRSGQDGEPVSLIGQSLRAGGRSAQRCGLRDAVVRSPRRPTTRALIAGAKAVPPGICVDPNSEAGLAARITASGTTFGTEFVEDARPS